MRGRRFEREARVTRLAALLLAWAPVVAGAQAASGSAAPAGQVQVLRWVVTGNTLLPDAQLQAVLAPFTGSRSLADLQRAARAVQDLYAAAGYGGVVAYVPEQAVDQGVVTVAVVEGKLGAVQVQGQRHFGEDDIRASLPALRQGSTVNLKRLDAEIELANENPAKQLRVLLMPGTHPGESAARVSVIEQPVQRWSLSADNTGNAATGRARANLAWQDADLTGRDDVLAAQLTTAPSRPGAVKVISAGYHLPLYADLAALDVYAGLSDIDSGSASSAAGDIGFSGKGRAAGMRLTRHLLRMGDTSARVSVGLDYRAYLNQCAIAGLPEGACGPAGESVAVQPMTVEYAAQAAGRFSWSAAVSLSANLELGAGMNDAAHFAAVRFGATPGFVVLHANGSAETAVADGWRVRARAAAQASGDALVPGEQFGIGGAGSVRGYEERELAGDRGTVASLELLAPEAAWAGGRLVGLAFADAGWVGNNHGLPCLDGRSNCHLYGAGFGARWSQGGLQGALYLAESLSHGATTLQHRPRVHVSVAYGF
jgi:hemolysin activation/secretion protein